MQDPGENPNVLVMPTLQWSEVKTREGSAVVLEHSVKVFLSCRNSMCSLFFILFNKMMTNSSITRTCSHSSINETHLPILYMCTVFISQKMPLGRLTRVKVKSKL